MIPSPSVVSITDKTTNKHHCSTKRRDRSVFTENQKTCLNQAIDDGVRARADCKEKIQELATNIDLPYDTCWVYIQNHSRGKTQSSKKDSKVPKWGYNGYTLFLKEGDKKVKEGEKPKDAMKRWADEYRSLGDHTKKSFGQRAKLLVPDYSDPFIRRKRINQIFGNIAQGLNELGSLGIEAYLFGIDLQHNEAHSLGTPMGDAFSHTEAHKRELDNFRVFLRLRGVTGEEILDEKKKEKSKNSDRQKKISAAITDKYRAFCGNPKAHLPRKRLSEGTLLVRGLPSDLEAKLVTGIQSAGTHDLLRLESLMDQVEFCVPSESVGTQDVVDVNANIPAGNVQQDGLVISSYLETAKDSSEILSDLLAGSILEETGEDITSDATIQDNNDTPPLQHVSALADLSSGGYLNLARIEKSKASAKSCPKRSVRRNAASGSSDGMSEQQVAETDEPTKLGKGKKRRKVASAGKAKAGNRGEKKKKTDNKEYVIKSLRSYDAELDQYEIEWLGYSSSYNLMQAADTIPGHFISEYWTRQHTITIDK